MKIKVVLIVVLCVLMPLTLVSDTQRRIKVHIQVFDDPDTDLDDRLESFLKKEFRSIGDIDIVNSEHSDWHFLCVYRFLEIGLKDGRKTGWLSIASATFVSVPKLFVNFDRAKMKTLFDKPVFFRGLTPAHWETDNLHEYAIQDAAFIDKHYFEHWRIP